MDENKNAIDAAEAARALEEISGTRHAVAARVGAPSGYYLRLGVSTAILVLAQAADDPWRMVGLIVALAVLGWAVRDYRRATGTWTMASLRIPGVWRFWVMAAVMMAALLVAMEARSWIASLGGAAAILAVVPTFGPRWDADWVRSLERDA